MYMCVIDLPEQETLDNNRQRYYYISIRTHITCVRQPARVRVSYAAHVPQ